MEENKLLKELYEQALKDYDSELKENEYLQKEIESLKNRLEKLEKENKKLYKDFCDRDTEVYNLNKNFECLEKYTKYIQEYLCKDIFEQIKKEMEDYYD